VEKRGRNETPNFIDKFLGNESMDKIQNNRAEQYLRNTNQKFHDILLEKM
jgi:hypothetical protein